MKTSCGCLDEFDKSRLNISSISKVGIPLEVNNLPRTLCSHSALNIARSYMKKSSDIF